MDGTLNLQLVSSLEGLDQTGQNRGPVPPRVALMKAEKARIRLSKLVLPCPA